MSRREDVPHGRGMHAAGGRDFSYGHARFRLEALLPQLLNGLLQVLALLLAILSQCQSANSVTALLALSIGTSTAAGPGNPALSRGDAIELHRSHAGFLRNVAENDIRRFGPQHRLP